MPPYPHDDMLHHQVSLNQFVREAEHLLVHQHDPRQFVKYVLAGRTPAIQGSSAKRIFVNARQGAFRPGPGEYKTMSDFDSYIGESLDLPFKQALSVFPVAPFSDTLTNSNHLTRKIQILRVFIVHHLMFVSSNLVLPLAGIWPAQCPLPPYPKHGPWSCCTTPSDADYVSEAL
jgi:hypothetical protein